MDEQDLFDRLTTIPGLDVAAGLRFVHGKPQTYLRILGLFVRTHGDDVARLRSQFDKAAFPELMEEAHKLKGGAGSCGALEVQRIASELQDAARDKDSTAVAIALDQLAAALPNLVAGLEDTLPPGQ